MRLQSRTRLGGVVAAALGVALVGAAVPSAALASDCAVSPAPTAVTASAAPAETITTTASVDAPLTQLFGHYGDTAGRWTGADSAYSVALPGGKTAWLYSDTFLGAVNADHSRPQDAPFIHNSIIVADRGTLATYTGGTAAAPASLVAVPGGDENQKWFWFGDGTVEGSHLRVTLLEFAKTGTGQWDFAFDHTAVASFSLPSMRLRGHHGPAGRHGGMGIRDLRGPRLHLRLRRRRPGCDQVPPPRAGEGRKADDRRVAVPRRRGLERGRSRVEADHGRCRERVQREPVRGQSTRWSRAMPPSR